MDLWIRSQDRTKLVKADNISYMDVAEDYEKEVHSLWNDCKGILGTYKTKERALEVLDEIQGLFIKKDIVKTEISKDGLTMVNMPITCIVYEMPEK